MSQRPHAVAILLTALAVFCAGCSEVSATRKPDGTWTFSVRGQQYVGVPAGQQSGAILDGPPSQSVVVNDVAAKTAQALRTDDPADWSAAHDAWAEGTAWSWREQQRAIENPRGTTGVVRRSSAAGVD